jgi:hypothetical protein
VPCHNDLQATRIATSLQVSKIEGLERREYSLSSDWRTGGLEDWRTGRLWASWPGSIRILRFARQPRNLLKMRSLVSADCRSQDRPPFWI